MMFIGTIMMLRMPAPPQRREKFVVDRPAYFMLARGNIPLFVGNLVNP